MDVPYTTVSMPLVPALCHNLTAACVHNGRSKRKVGHTGGQLNGPPHIAFVVEVVCHRPQFIAVMLSCSTVASDTQTKYGTWATATQR